MDKQPQERTPHTPPNACDNPISSRSEIKKTSSCRCEGEEGNQDVQYNRVIAYFGVVGKRKKDGQIQSQNHHVTDVAVGLKSGYISFGD